MTGIGDFRKIHDGKRVFILASGPSLAGLDLSRLSRRMVIGLNRSILAWPEPFYHCCMDHRLFDEYAEALRRVRYLITLEDRPWGIPLRLVGAEGFSWDLEQGIYSGYTIAYFALQVAVYMGFTEIFFVGLDLQHQQGQTHFFGTDFHSRNHESTEFPKMRKMLHYGAAALEGRGIQVFNCSPVSDLKCFPTMSFQDALAR